ncbi:MAG: hypothetical protein M3552_09985 [Planctomycetota bacterium]|nr:hypothetical protein [Planctomycetota bacterium]
MKLLKIENSSGYFLAENGEFLTVDKLAKEHLLRLITLVVDSEPTEMDDFDESQLKNQAHQIIYKSVHRKLMTLKARRKEFLDESARLFLEDYEKYRPQAGNSESLKGVSDS